YQGTTIRNLQGGSSAFVPTAANVNGDFSAILSATDPANPLRRAITVIDPLTGQAFAGNKIPSSRFDPAAVKLMTFLPQAGGNGSVFYTKPISQNFNEQVTRVDHSFNTNDRMTGRYFRDQFHSKGIFDPKNILTYADQADILSQNALIQE